MPPVAVPPLGRGGAVTTSPAIGWWGDVRAGVKWGRENDLPPASSTRLPPSSVTKHRWRQHAATPNQRYRARICGGHRCRRGGGSPLWPDQGSVGGIPRHPAGCAGPKLPPSGRIGNPTWERLWGGERSKGVGAFTYHPVLAPRGNPPNPGTPPIRLYGQQTCRAAAGPKRARAGHRHPPGGRYEAGSTPRGERCVTRTPGHAPR